MMRKALLYATLLTLVLALPLAAQISKPHTFADGETIDASRMNANFDGVFDNALNRAGGTMTGTLTARAVVPDGNNTRDLGASGTRWAAFYTVLANISGALTLGGGQIVFPASQSASADANTLDDYEEGTWTPVIGGAGGQSGQAYTHQNGYYTKVGNLVCVQFDVLLSTEGTITGNLQVSGLPVTSSSGTNARTASQLYYASLDTAFVDVIGTINPGETAIVVSGNTAAAVNNTTNLSATNTNNTTRFIGAVCYRGA